MKPRQLFQDRVILWVNTMSLERAVSTARDFRGCTKTVLISSNFFLAHGPNGVRCFYELGIPNVILDLKLLGTKKEIWQCVHGAAAHAVKAISVNTLAGTAAVENAIEAAEASKLMTYKVKRPKILISMLPIEMDDATLVDDIGMRIRRKAHVENAARQVVNAGADGIVAEAEDLPRIRRVSRKIPTLVYSQRGVRNPTVVETEEEKDLAGITELMQAGVGHVIFDSVFVEKTDAEWASDLIRKEMSFQPGSQGDG